MYQLKLEFKADGGVSDSQAIEFGVRKITQKRDSDESFPAIGTGGNFYLQINGRDYLIRGGVYSPDLLFRNDPDSASMSSNCSSGVNRCAATSTASTVVLIAPSLHHLPSSVGQ